MPKSRLSRSKEKAILEKKKRTLLVYMPFKIRSKEQVKKLFTGQFVVRMPRQPSRRCHVLFPSVEEMAQNFDAAQDATIDGKRIIVWPLPRAIGIEKRTTVSKKKVVMPRIEEQPKITQTLFVSNIRCGTTIGEIKEALEGCQSVKMLQPFVQTLRSAIVKMENIRIAAEYLTGQREPPVVRGNKLRLQIDSRRKHKKIKSKTRKPVKTEQSDSKSKDNADVLSLDTDSDRWSPAKPSKGKSVGSTTWQISKAADLC